MLQKLELLLYTVTKLMILSKKPLVSVIIASYNHKNFVREAITSVLEQTVKNIEVIVVDDGSTDGTQKVIEKIQDSRIKFIRLPENRLKHPRNLALSLAKGKYVAFQNSDDVWNPNKLAKQLAAFKTGRNTVACFTGVDIISKTGNKLQNSWAKNLFKTENKKSEEWLRYFFDIGNCLCISSALVKSSALKRTGLFDESLIQLSDFDMWIHMTMIGELQTLNENLTQMRIVKGKNVSAPSPETHRRSTLERAQILERYTGKQIDLYKVFPDVIKTRNLPTPINQTYLAHYSWKKSLAHKLFAETLFTKLLGKRGLMDLRS